MNITAENASQNSVFSFNFDFVRALAWLSYLHLQGYSAKVAKLTMIANAGE